MLLNFTVENFRSFKGRCELWMEAADEPLGLETHVAEVGDARVLRTAAIFGANASGKSNLFQAMALALGVLRSPDERARRAWLAAVQPFRFSEEAVDFPTEFEFDFLVQGERYQYDFSVLKGAILSESLCLYGEEYSHPIFLRQENRYRFPDTAYAKNLQPLAARNADDQLFLVTAAAAGAEPAAQVFDWFQSVDVLDLQDASLRQKIMPLLIEQLQADEDHSLKDFLCTFLHKADIDICDYIVEGEGDAARLRLVHSAAERMYADDEFDASLDAEDESEGTIQLLLLGVIFKWAFEEGETLFIDDFDAHFHPLLVCYLVRLFQDPEINRADAQLIFSAHTTDLLSPRILRRDEIYFVDKDRRSGVSDFYSLQEFKPTSYKDIRKAYLLGRYDAVPRVNDGELLY
ncbi:MAG: ATP/GTP-binding protein [Lachnospiraceae bacterium]